MHPYINHVIKTAERNKDSKITKKKELFEQIKAKTRNEAPQQLEKNSGQDSELLTKLKSENQELKKQVKKLENRINEQAQKTQNLAAKSARLDAENKSLRTSLYETSTELKKEKRAIENKQDYIEMLERKCKIFEEKAVHMQNQLVSVRGELARTQALTNTNSNSYKSLRESMNKLQKLNGELTLQLETEKQFREDQDQLEKFKQIIRSQAAHIHELKLPQSGLISKANVQELYDALREKLDLAKPTHKHMLVELFNRLKRIKRRFQVDVREPDHLVDSRMLYGYVMKTGDEYHFYSLENGLYRVHAHDSTFETDLPVKAEIIHEYEVRIVKQYSYHFVPRGSSSIKGSNKASNLESKKGNDNPFALLSNPINVLIIGSKNRSKYIKSLAKYGFTINWYDGYEESPEVLKSKREGIDVVIICTGHSPHFVLDLFQDDDARVEKVYKENVNSIYHRIRYNAIKQGLM
ncbi:hypothetical protein [Paenibacillus anseongense]|uniref:hypothetical protein n=1 Tax=Paenibacillus anseongense TaxID=2682845 RepID=UPI002DBDCE5B|nr:hypothetical protein [Paenibacillus anseongense]MEC0269728.1 hypothetical protein [Paenibacillus anseongense]